MDFQDWFSKLPLVTKSFMVGIFGVTTILSLGIISPKYLILTYDGLFENFYIWTLITNFLVFGKFGWGFIFTMVLVYFGFSRLEKFYSPNRMPEFIYLLLVNIAFIVIISIIFDQYYFMGQQLAFAVLYIWCKKEPMERVQFMFGFVFNSAYLPWAIMGWTLITGGGIMKDLIGVASGHLYIFLKDVLPASPYKYNWLKTPAFVERLVNKYYNPPNNNFQNVNLNQGQPHQQNIHFRMFGGRGVRLG